MPDWARTRAPRAVAPRPPVSRPPSPVPPFVSLSAEQSAATAAEEIVGRLTRLGVPVEVHRPTLFLSLPGSARVAVGAQGFRAKPMAMSVPYPEGVTAPLAYVPARYARNADEMFTKGFVSDTEVDLRGKIVLSEGFGMPGKVAYFQERGAIGMIAVNPGHNPHWGICTTVWGTPDLRDLPRKPKMAVVAVNNPDGQALIEMAKAGASVTLTSNVTEGWWESPIPVVTIPGTDEPENFVLLHGHYDSWDYGIGDNAVGDATLLEIARVLWEQRASLKRSVKIAWWPGHSTGRYAGSTWFADHFAIELYEHCIAQVNCDSPGCRWATEYKDISWMDETEAFCQGVIRDITGQESQGERPHQAGDYSFNNIGISSFFMLLSTMKDSHREELGYYAVGGCGANIAWHTEEDLIHIADRDILLKDIKIYLASVMGVANATIAPFNFRKTLATISATLDKYQAPVNGIYDFARARAAVAELDATLETLGIAACKAAAGRVTDPAVRRINRAIRRLARLLVPVNYTRGPEFFHDPAETTPALPDLSPALNAASMTPWEQGFLRTQLLRGENRLVAALRDARREVEEAMA